MSTNLFSPPGPGGTAGKQPCSSSFLPSTRREGKGKGQAAGKINNLKKRENSHQPGSKKVSLTVKIGGVIYKVVESRWVKTERKMKRRRSQKKKKKV